MCVGVSRLIVTNVLRGEISRSNATLIQERSFESGETRVRDYVLDVYNLGE